MIQSLYDTIRLAFRAFAAHPLRTLLTLLGIVIGVATVTSMMALLEGLRLKVHDDFSRLGANVFRIDKWPPGFHVSRRDWKKIARRPALTLDDKRAFAQHCPSVRQTGASAWQPAQQLRTMHVRTQADVFIIGATTEYPALSGIDVAKGRMFNKAEEISSRRVVVLGPDVADKLFPFSAPLGHQVWLGRRPYTVLGVTARRGQLLGMFNMDNHVLLPLGAFWDVYGQRRNISIFVEARSAAHRKGAQEEVTQLLRQRHKVTENDFDVSTNESMAQSLKDIISLITAATFGVCLLSLIIGGIGILNIMLMSVTERTREIGVRKALGARRRRILAQFSTEACIVSFLGGIIGIGIGFGVAFLGRWTFEMETSVPSWAVLLSLAMSSAVGLIFGMYPAFRAAALDPIEAMRAE